MENNTARPRAGQEGKMSENENQMPERIWVGRSWEQGWCDEQHRDYGYEYLRADLAHALESENHRLSRAIDEAKDALGERGPICVASHIRALREREDDLRHRVQELEGQLAQARAEGVREGIERAATICLSSAKWPNLGSSAWNIQHEYAQAIRAELEALKPTERTADHMPGDALEVLNKELPAMIEAQEYDETAKPIWDVLTEIGAQEFPTPIVPAPEMAKMVPTEDWQEAKRRVLERW